MRGNDKEENRPRVKGNDTNTKTETERRNSPEWKRWAVGSLNDIQSGTNFNQSAAQNAIILLLCSRGPSYIHSRGLAVTSGSGAVLSAYM